MTDLLRQRIAQCQTLPSIPAVAIEILRLYREENVQSAKIASVISKDPALTAKILRMINSPFFGLRQQISTISHAVVLLGLVAVRTIALSFTLVRGLRKRDAGGFSHTLFWKRSLIAATAAREIASSVGVVDKELAFLSALLQNIGSLLLNEIEPEDVYEISKQATSHTEQKELERQRIGSDHTEAGFWLARDWNLPAAITEPIRWHHDPDGYDGGDPEISELIRVVALSDLIAEVWISESREVAFEAAKDGAQDTWSMSYEAFTEIFDWVGVALPEISAVFDIEVGNQHEVSRIVQEARDLLGASPLADALSTGTGVRSNIALVTSGSPDDQGEEPAIETRIWDQLTGAVDRERFLDWVKWELGRSVSSGWPISLLLIEIDAFQMIGEQAGRLAGEKVLAGCASAITKVVRQSDMLARYGDETFALLMPDTKCELSEQIGERIRTVIEETTIAMGDLCVRPTVSIGTATSGDGTHFTEWAGLLEAGATALERAREAGGNCTEAYSGGDGREAA